MKRIVLITLAMLMVSVTVQAEVQQKFQIQGVLKNNDGVVMPDGDYSVTIKVYDAPTGGLLMWSEDTEIIQDGHVFTATLNNFYPATFERDTWLEIAFEGEAPMLPRTPIMPVPHALSATTVDPDHAVTRLNGKKGSITLVGGNNVTIVPSTSANELTIHADAGAGGDDGDWSFSGNYLYNASIDAVAIGTGTPHPWNDSATATTLQIKALFAPTLALDAQGVYPNNQLHRWTMTGGSTGVQFNYSDEYASYGTTALMMTTTGSQFNSASGETRVEIQTEAEMDDGGEVNIYSGATALPTVGLDGRGVGGGGMINVRDASGSDQVVIVANYNNTGTGRVTTPVLEITGGSDLSEQFDIGNASALTKPGMVVSIDPENPGGLTLSGKAYDRRVAGVISGAGGVNTGMLMGQRGTVADGELPVALVGRVYVWADASDGPIEPGDLLTTSDLPGHATKVTDHDQATGAILGKAMTGLNEGQGLILTLVTLQ